jgi:hypothetical protein
MARVFISHSSKDRGFVEQLVFDLRANGVGVWYDQWEIVPGDSLITKIGAAILDNDFFVVVLSRHSVRSEWVRRELGVALESEFRERHVSVIPALIEECTLPPFLLDKVYADFRQDYARGLASLLRGVASGRAESPAVSTVPSHAGGRTIWNNVVGDNITESNVVR